MPNTRKKKKIYIYNNIYHQPQNPKWPSVQGPTMLARLSPLDCLHCGWTPAGRHQAPIRELLRRADAESTHHLATNPSNLWQEAAVFRAVHTSVTVIHTWSASPRIWKVPVWSSRAAGASERVCHRWAKSMQESHGSLCFCRFISVRSTGFLFGRRRHADMRAFWGVSPTREQFATMLFCSFDKPTREPLLLTNQIKNRVPICVRSLSSPHLPAVIRSPEIGDVVEAGSGALKELHWTSKEALGVVERLWPAPCGRGRCRGNFNPLFEKNTH